MCIGEGSAKISPKKNSRAIVEKENSEGIAVPDIELNFKNELIQCCIGAEMNKQASRIIEQQTQKRPT